MEISREQLIEMVSEKCGFFKKDVRKVFYDLEDVVLECFGEVTDDEPISIRIMQGFTLTGYVVSERIRRDPRNNETIICKPCVKTSSKYSELFKEKIQKQYEDKKTE